MLMPEYFWPLWRRGRRIRPPRCSADHGCCHGRTAAFQGGDNLIGGPNRGHLEWHRPNRNTLLTMLHNPVYAGAYRYGHRHLEPRRRRPGRPKSGTVRVALEQCRVLIQDRFPAYISWDEFTENQTRLIQNQWRANAQDALRGGPSLLGGLVYCGRCGQRLMVQYCGRANRLRYQCGRGAQNRGEPLCQGIVGRDLDQFMTERIFEILEPASLELSLAATRACYALSKTIFLSISPRKATQCQPARVVVSRS